MNRRILVNLGVFCLLGVVLTVWALRNVLSLAALTQPYQISAQFSSSPGLQPNFDVAYLGVTVGKIKSVRLADHMIIATLSINKGEHIPSNVTAAAGHQSAIGEPFVDLELPSGQTGGPPLRPGAVIPLARTTVAASYSSLFTAVNRAVDGLDATDLGTVTHELALGWDGRGTSLQELIDSTGQISTDFAANTKLLDSLVRQLSLTSTTLAAHSDALAGGVGGMADFTHALAAANKDFASIRDTAPDLLNRVNTIMGSTQAANKCTLSALGAALPSALDAAALAGLRYTADHGPGVASILKEIASTIDGKPTINTDFVITLDKPKPTLEYKALLPLPTVGEIPGCAGVNLPAMPTRDAASGGAAAAAAATPAPVGTGKAVPAAQRVAGSGSGSGNAWVVYLPPLVALAALLSAAVRFVPVLVRRRRR